MSGSYIILGEERDGMFYTPEMSRRARIIELWATLKYLGKKGIDEMIYIMHQRAQQFAQIQNHRDCWVGGSIWEGEKVIRISICSWATTEEDIIKSAKSFTKALMEVKAA